MRRLVIVVAVRLLSTHSHWDGGSSSISRNLPSSMSQVSVLNTSDRLQLRLRLRMCRLRMKLFPAPRLVPLLLLPRCIQSSFALLSPRLTPLGQRGAIDPTIAAA